MCSSLSLELYGLCETHKTPEVECRKQAWSWDTWFQLLDTNTFPPQMMRLDRPSWEAPSTHLTTVRTSLIAYLVTATMFHSGRTPLCLTAHFEKIGPLWEAHCKSPVNKGAVCADAPLVPQTSHLFSCHRSGLHLLPWAQSSPAEIIISNRSQLFSQHSKLVRWNAGQPLDVRVTTVHQ